MSPHSAIASPASGRARRAARRIAVVGVTGAVALIGVVGTASAHVKLDPDTAAQGSDATVAFQVPNEEDSASTVSLQVSFPTDHPVPSVDVQPVPGWTATVKKAPLATPVNTDDGPVSEAVSTITWTGGAIAPGQFEQFPVSLGNLPDNAGSLTFKAIQTYSNGDVVRWIDLTTPGGPEPEHPAPTLTLTPATDSGTATPAAASTDTAAPASGTGGSTGTVLGIIGVVLGLIGAVTGGLALRKRSGTA
jgi:uncharacterized protein YcnI